MRDTGAAVRERSDDAARAAIVADDLTGAADAGVSFASAGFATTVTWSMTDVESLRRGCDAIAIDVETRAMGETRAAAEVSAAVSALRCHEVATLYKKGDSLLRGHVGAEAAAALAAWHPGAIGIATFAFPEAGRTTVHGRQYTRELANGLSIAPLFNRAGLATTVLELDAIRGGRLREHMAEAVSRRSRVICCDAETTEDLSRIVRAGAEQEAPVVWIGSGGLARAVAVASAGARDRSARAVPARSQSGPVMVVCGSVSPIARQQISCALEEEEDPVERVEVPIEVLRSRDREDEQRVLSAIRQRLDLGRDVIVFPSVLETSIDPSVSRALGELLSSFRDRVGGLVVTGGDTASAVLRAWGITGLRIVGEVAPGAPIAVAIGSIRIAVVTKPGAFGDREFFVEARRKLHAMVDEGSSPP